MISFNPIEIDKNIFVFKELTYKGALHISVIDKNLNEKRITEFLNFVLPNQDALMMTAQARYYLLVNYLSKQTKTMLGIDVHFEAYLRSGTNPWRNNITVDGVTVRQLYGFEAERLERDCKSIAEWMGCLLAMQLSYDNDEVLSGILDPKAEDYEFQFSNRLQHIKEMGLSDWDTLYNDYCWLNQQLFTHCEITVCDEGLGLQGGTDDAPLRFCPSAAFNRFIGELDKHHFREGEGLS